LLNSIGTHRWPIAWEVAEVLGSPDFFCNWAQQAGQSKGDTTSGITELVEASALALFLPVAAVAILPNPSGIGGIISKLAE